jgi:hypothetical protein
MQLIAEFEFLAEPVCALFSDSDFGLLVGHSNIVSEIRSDKFAEKAKISLNKLNK